MLELNKIYQGDCLEVMKQLPDKCIDLVLTDPPYGISCVSNSNRLKQLGYKQFINDDSKLPIGDIARKAKHNIIFGGNYFDLPISRGWLVWDKQDGKRVDFGDCELVYTDFDIPIRKYTHVWDGFRRDSEWGVKRVHPCQKPVELIKQILKDFSSPDDVILDCFAGSGSTLVAAELLGRKWIGIEISPEYCKIAEKRIKEAKDSMALFSEVG